MGKTGRKQDRQWGHQAAVAETGHQAPVQALVPEMLTFILLPSICGTCYVLSTEVGVRKAAQNQGCLCNLQSRGQRSSLDFGFFFPKWGCSEKGKLPSEIPFLHHAAKPHPQEKGLAKGAPRGSRGAPSGCLSGCLSAARSLPHLGLSFSISKTKGLTE